MVKETGQRPLTGVDSKVYTKVAIRVIYAHLHCSHLHPHEQNMPSDLAIFLPRSRDLSYISVTENKL